MRTLKLPPKKLLKKQILKRVKVGCKERLKSQRKLKGKTEKKFLYKSDLKELENNDFSHLIALATFHIRYFLEEQKICSSITSNIFQTLGNLLPMKIIRTAVL